jgi:hypothetical protein
MPKLRPLKKPEEIAAVPADQPVAIDLSPAESPEPEAPETLGEQPRDAAGRFAATPPPEPEEPEEGAEPAENSLAKQLEAAKQAEAAAKQRADAEAARAEAALRQARETEANLARERAGREQAEYDTVVNAIGAAQAELEKAESDYEAAAAAQDWKAAAAAQRRMSTAGARLVQLEDGKVAIEARREEEKKRPDPPPQAHDFEAKIAALPEPAKTWLRARPEYMNDQDKNEQIGAAHNYVVKVQRKQAWTPEYFEALETHLGIRKSPTVPDPEPEPQPQTRRSPPMSAPVSRDAPNLSTGRPQSRTITLSPAQRDAARISGISETEYAKNLIRLNELKAQGHYQER